MASPDTTAHDTPTPNVLSRAMYFGSADQPCLGWWHAVQGPSSLAVVVCAPFGLEDLSAYRSLKYLATSLAAAGLPTLRFDYAGCGDSGGDDEEGDQVAAWIQSIHAAVELSKSLSGASQVALVGLRLGALLAAAAATERDDIQTLVAIAPPASGRAFVRDCRLLGAVAGVGAARADGRLCLPSKSKMKTLSSSGRSTPIRFPTRRCKSSKPNLRRG